MCVQTTCGPFWKRWQPDLYRGADKHWAWLVQYLQRIRVSRTTRYRAGKGEEVTGINSLWLEKLPRLLQWIKRWNVAERVGNTLSLFTPYNEKKLMADLCKPIFVWILFLWFQDSEDKILDFRLFRQWNWWHFVTKYLMTLLTEWLIHVSAVPVDLSEPGITLCKMERTYH